MRVKYISGKVLVAGLTMLMVMLQSSSKVDAQITDAEALSIVNSPGIELVLEDYTEIESASLNISSVLVDVYNTNSNVRKPSKTASSVKTSSVYDTKPSTYKYASNSAYYLTNYPELRSAMEDLIGKNNIFNGRATSLSACYSGDIQDVMNSKDGREALAKIAYDAGLIGKTSYEAADEVALFTYYGIINNDEDPVSLDYNNSAVITREQAAAVLNNFMHGIYSNDNLADSNTDLAYKVLGKDNVYKSYIQSYSDDMLLAVSPRSNTLTKKEASSGITRLEAIYMLLYAYDIGIENSVTTSYASADSQKFVIKSYSDIDASTFTLTKAQQKEFEALDTNMDRARFRIENKKLTGDLARYIQAANEMKLLKTSNGKINIFGEMTQSQFIRMLVAYGNQADRYYK